MKLLYYINTSEIPSELSRENFIFADAGPKYINAGRLLLFTRKKTGIVRQRSWNRLSTRVAINNLMSKQLPKSIDH